MRSPLLSEEARLACGDGRYRRLTARDTHHAKYGYFGEGGAGNEDAIGRGVQVGRSDLQAVVEYGEQVVGDDALEGVVVREAQADPEAIEFRAAEKGFAFRLEIVRKFADKVDGADPGKGNLHVLAVRSEDVDGVRLPESRRTEIATQGCLIQERDHDFFVRRGWGSVLQRIRTLGNRQICETPKCMLC